MFGKKKKAKEIEEPIKTVFDIPSEEAKEYLSSIIKDVNVIISNPKFIQATKKAYLPDNPTIKDVEELLTRVAPAKIYSFLSLFMEDCYEELRRILSAIFITDYEVYKEKSLRAMCEDIAKLDKTHIGQLLSFFIHLGR